MSTPVSIKKGVRVPGLLQNFVDFGFQCIRDDPAFGSRCESLNSLDTRLKIKFRKIVSDDPNRFVDVKLGNSASRRIPTSLVNTANIRKFANNNPSTNKIPDELRVSFRDASRNVESIECSGLFIDYLLTKQNLDYLSVKMAIVANEMLIMNKNGVDSALFDFLTKFNSGLVEGLVRHAQKPKDGPDGFKIAWHRDSNVNVTGQHKGMVTVGLYIHRPDGIVPESGGISFAKDMKEVRLFPESGTVVTFLDQHVIHKVIPVKLTRALPAENHGFVQRTAAFMSWHTSTQLINTHSTNSTKSMFTKAGISPRYRNLKQLYLLLHKYLLFLNRKHASPMKMKLEDFIHSAPNNKVTAAYRGNGSNNADKVNYINLLKAGSYNVPKPVADLILYKQSSTAANNTPRAKLRNLHSVYYNLRSSFGPIGAGIGRTNKPSLLAKRGGRTQLNVASSGFIRNLNTKNTATPMNTNTKTNQR